MGDVITAAVPAAIALLVVWIGGRQTRNRQSADFANAEGRWRDEQAFERAKFRFQERRAVYAEYLRRLDRLAYVTTHVIGQHHSDHPPNCEACHDDAEQDWMAAHDELERVSLDVAVIASEEWYALVRMISSIYRDLWPIDATSDTIEAWFGAPGEDRGRTLARLDAYRMHLVVVARIEMSMETDYTPDLAWDDDPERDSPFVEAFVDADRIAGNVEDGSTE